VTNTVSSEIMQYELGGLVSLYELDTTVIGGIDVYHFTPDLNTNGTFITWQGYTFTQFPIEVAGVSWSGAGEQVRPKLRVSNVNKVLMAALNSLDDLVGAKLTRWRTFAQYLNGVDDTKMLNEEIFVVRKKVEHTANLIEWEIGQLLDRPNFVLPRRIMLRDGDEDVRFPGLGRNRIR